MWTNDPKCWKWTKIMVFSSQDTHAQRGTFGPRLAWAKNHRFWVQGIHAQRERKTPFFGCRGLALGMGFWVTLSVRPKSQFQGAGDSRSAWLSGPRSARGQKYKGYAIEHSRSAWHFGPRLAQDSEWPNCAAFSCSGFLGSNIVIQHINHESNHIRITILDSYTQNCGN